MRLLQAILKLPATAFIVSVLLGAVLCLGGAGPMMAALVVSNQVIDDGPQPGDQEIMNKWDAWAFSPAFISCFVGGLAVMAASFWLLSKKADEINQRPRT